MALASAGASGTTFLVNTTWSLQPADSSDKKKERGTLDEAVLPVAQVYDPSNEDSQNYGETSEVCNCKMIGLLMMLSRN